MPTNLRSELKKRDPFEMVEIEAALSIVRTSDLLENRATAFMRSHGLTPSQYNVLRILRGEGKPMPCLEVADRMIQATPAITRIVNQLLALDLIIKKQCPDDRRIFRIELNDAAKALLKKMDQPLLDFHEALLSQVSQDDLTTLIKTLDRVRLSMRNMPEPG